MTQDQEIRDFFSGGKRKLNLPKLSKPNVGKAFSRLDSRLGGLGSRLGNSLTSGYHTIENSNPAKYLGSIHLVKYVGSAASGIKSAGNSMYHNLESKVHAIDKKKAGIIVTGAAVVALAGGGAYFGWNNYQNSAVTPSSSPTAASATATPTGTPTAGPKAESPSITASSINIGANATYQSGNLELMLETSDSSNLAERIEVYSGGNKIDGGEVKGSSVLDLTLPAGPHDLTVKIYDRNGKFVEYGLKITETTPGKNIETTTQIKPEQTVSIPTVIEEAHYVLPITKEQNSIKGPLEVFFGIVTKGSPIDALREYGGRDTMFNNGTRIVYADNVDGLPDEIKREDGRIGPLHIGDNLVFSTQFAEKYGIVGSNGVKFVPAKETTLSQYIPAEYDTTTTFEPPVYETTLEKKISPAQSMIPFGGHPLADPNNTLDSRILAGIAAATVATAAVFKGITSGQYDPTTPALKSYRKTEIAPDDIDLMLHLYEETDLSIREIRQIMMKETGMNMSVGTFYRIVDGYFDGARRKDNSSTAAYEKYCAQMDSIQKPLMQKAA